MIKPYDFGKINLADVCQKIKIDDLVRVLKKDLKRKLITSQLNSLGYDINLVTSKTKFSGERIYFVCPNCNLRVGVIYKHPTLNILGCRTCLGIKYRKRRYKGMIENEVNR